MNVKTFKRMSKRFISTLLSVLMVLSLFSVCMVGTTLTASAGWTASSRTITIDASSTGWGQVYLYIGNYDNLNHYLMTQNDNGTYSCTVTWDQYDGFFFADGIYNHATENKVYNTHESIPKTSRSTKRYQEELPEANKILVISTVTTKVTADITNTNWDKVYLYIGSSSNLYVYEMEQIGQTKQYTYTVPEDVVTGGFSGYFFSNQAKPDGVANISDAYDAISIKNKSSVGTDKVEDITYYQQSALPSSPVNVIISNLNSVSNYYIDATVYNYRTTYQVQDTNSSSTVESEMFTVDTQNGMPDKIKHNDMYLQYNQKVSEWFSTKAATLTDKKATPLYEGNFHDIYGGTTATINDTYYEKIGYVEKTFYNWVRTANSANRYNNSANISSSAQGLVDKELSNLTNIKSATIVQNGIELPQFSDTFTEQNPTLQSKYSDLKFQVTAVENANGNTWYSYDSATDGNRYLDLETRTLTKGENVYGYSDENLKMRYGTPGYFPFNETNPSEGSKNLINSHGTRFDVTFVMPNANGVANGNEPLQFNFTGDDDLWVYIDGYLALDLGGSHDKAEGSINLSTSEVDGVAAQSSYVKTGYYDGTYATQSTNNTTTYDGVSYNNTKTTAFSDELKASLADLTKEHTMTIFYMERGQYESNLSFEFMLPQSSSLTIEEKIDYSAVNPGLYEPTLLTADFDAFGVTLNSDSKSASSNETAEIPVTQDFIRADAAGVLTTAQVKNKTNRIPAGKPFDNAFQAGTMSSTAKTTFVWTDSNKSLDGTKVSSGTGTGRVSDDGVVSLLYNQSAVFNDQFTSGSNLWFAQNEKLNSFSITIGSEEPPITIPNNRNVSNYYKTEFSVTDYAGRTVGTEAVKVDEGKPSEKTYNKVAFQNKDNEAPDNVKLKVTYTNTIKTGEIKFTKKVLEGETYNENTVFDFQVQFSNVFGGTNDKWQTYPIEYYLNSATTPTKLDPTQENPNPVIHMKVDDTITIKGVPVGTRYRIVEVGEDDGNKEFAVAGVTPVTGKDTAIQNMTNTTGGIIATVGTVTEGETNSAELDFDNTANTVKVYYRFVDRLVTTGLPTSMENHYTYFTKEVPGTATTVTADTVLKYAPKIENVLSEYGLSKDDIELSYTIQSADRKEIGADESATEKYDGTAPAINETVILATYKHTPRLYKVNFTYVQDDYYVDDKFNQSTVGQVVTNSVEKEFNKLVQFSDYINTKPVYTDAAGKTHKFMYWAKLVDVDGGDSAHRTYTPISTNFSYTYRVTDDAEIKAVYDTDPDFVKLEAPEVNVGDGSAYQVTGENSGYDASAAERVYDSYSKDDKDYTRVNVTFGSVGSRDTDTDISQIGYVIIKNKGGYATDSEFPDDFLTTTLVNSQGKITKIKGSSGTEYNVQVGVYDNTDGLNSNPAGWADNNWTNHYTANKINLTNKNRVNLVFNLLNNETTQQNYFTCYTFMVRTVTNEDGSTNSYTYVSNTPAFFNLKEADPLELETTDVENSYLVSASVNDSKMGSISVNESYIKDQQQITITVKPTAFEDGGSTFVSTLESLQFGDLLIDTEDEFTAYKLSKTNESSATITFFKNTHLASEGATTLTIKANFKAQENSDTAVYTSVPHTGGKVMLQETQNGNLIDKVTVNKGKTFYITAVPDDGYEFSHWLDESGNTNEQRAIEFTGTKFELPTPVFNKKQYSLTVNAENGGTVEYSYSVDQNNQYSGIASPSDPAVINGYVDTEITLTAKLDSEAEGNSFDGWADASGKIVSNDATYTYTLTNSATQVLTAKFTTPIPKYDVTVNIVGNGTVKNKATSEAISNGTVIKVEQNSSITLIAQPADGHKFVEWKYADGTQLSTSPECTVAPSAATTVVAVFEEIEYVTFTVYNGDNGTVSVKAEGYQNTGNTYTVVKGTEVEITATAFDGYEFTNWTDANGNAVSTINPLTFTPNGGESYTANFAESKKYIYFKPTSEWLNDTNVTKFSMYFYGGDGTPVVELVDSDGDGWYEGLLPEKTYTNVIFRAESSNNQWYKKTDDLDTPTDNTNIYFTLSTGTWGPAPVFYNVTINSGANGKVTYNNQTINANGTLTISVEGGSTITLTPTPSSTNYQFNKWTVTGNVTQNNNSFTINGEASITASFKVSTGKTIYFKPSESWKQAGARFAIYLHKDGYTAWYSMTHVGNGYYSAYIPNEQLSWNVIFCRMDPKNSTNDWPYKWNQTPTEGGYQIPTDKNLYTLYANNGTPTDGVGGSWSNYS